MQFFPTAVCSVTAWRHSRLRDHWLMALIGEEGAEGEACILHSPGIAASPISLLSMGGVCGRSLTAGKILFTGRQSCSLYLVLWLCGQKKKECMIGKLWGKWDTVLHFTMDNIYWIIWFGTQKIFFYHMLFYLKKSLQLSIRQKLYFG